MCLLCDVIEESRNSGQALPGGEMIYCVIRLVSFDTPELNVFKRGRLAVTLPKKQEDNEVQMIYTGKATHLHAL